MLLDALVREEHEHQQREHQRERDVRVRGIDLERRPVDPEQQELLAGVDRQRDVADQVRDQDEDEDRRDQREVLSRHRLIERLVGHVARERVEHLDRDLQPARAFAQPLGHVEQDADRDDGGQQDVEHALVEVDRADAEPGIELELVRRREHARGDRAGLVGAEADDRDEEDDPTEPDRADGEQHLAQRAHPLMTGGGVGSGGAHDPLLGSGGPENSLMTKTKV